MHIDTKILTSTCTLIVLVSQSAGSKIIYKMKMFNILLFLALNHFVSAQTSMVKAKINTQAAPATIVYEPLNWVLFNGKVPDNALAFGREANGDAQCACLDIKTRKVGKFLVKTNECLYANYGKEVASKKFNILIGSNSYKLEDWNARSMYPNAFTLTYSTVPNEILPIEKQPQGLLTTLPVYLGLFEYQGGLHIGHIYNGGTFVITYGGQVVWGNLDKKEGLRPVKILVSKPRPN